MLRYFKILLSLSVVVCSDLFSQPEFKHYGIDEGFSDISIRSMLQDQKGFLWFATLNGLNRFDGKNIKIYKPEPGNPKSLSYNRIASLNEDSYGNIWILTYDKGLNLFNPETEEFSNITAIIQNKTGKNFQTNNFVETSPGICWAISRTDGTIKITFKPGNDLTNSIDIEWFHETNLLPGNFVYFVLKDKIGQIWIGTDKGLLLLKNEAENAGSSTSVKYFYSGDDQTRVLVYCETKEAIWFGTNNKGILNYSFKEKQLTSWDRKKITTPVSYIKEGNANDLLIATIGEGLIYVKGDNSVVHLKPGQKRNDIVVNNYFVTYKDRFGKFWVCNQKRGVTLFDPSTMNITYYGMNPEYRESAGESDNPKIFEDSNGDLWVGLYGGGICLLDREKMKFEQYYYNAESPKSLSSNLVNSIMEDNSRNLWISTYQGGVNKIELTKYQFHFIKPYKNPDFQSYNEIRAVFVDSFNRLWIGTKEGHVFCYNEDLEVIFSIPEDLGNDYGFVKSNVYELFGDKKGNLWIGTKGSGIILIKGILSSENMVRKKYVIKNFLYSGILDSLSVNNNDIYGIIEDNTGQIWIGTYNGGLNLIKDTENITFDFYRNDPDNPSSLSDDRVRHIMQDSKNNIWISTVNGLNLVENQYLNKKEKKFIRLYGTGNNNVSVANNDVLKLIEDSKGRIWIGTYGGGLNILKTDKNNKYFFETIKMENGLPSDVIMGIEEDKNGLLWLSTDNGLCNIRYNNQELIIEKYLKEEGIGDNLFSESTSAKMKSGQLIFGQKNGFIVFHPDSIRKDTFSYNVWITRLKIKNKIAKSGNLGSPLTKSIESTKEITLNYDQNFIELSYAIMDFTFPDRCNYRYKLDGVDNDWVYVGNHTTATYTNLDPGNYIFTVEAANHDGFWSKYNATLIINITPPFYEKWWFRIMLFILIAGLVIGFYYYRMNAMKQRQAILEKLVKERTFEIEEKNRILLHQTDELNQINTILEERQNYIEEQAEELRAQKDRLEIINASLNESNTLLEERQQQVEEQSEELKVQAEDLGIKNEDLKKSNATKDKLFSIIAHDLKNPFNSILGFCKIILTKYDTMDEEKVKHLVDIVYNSAKGIYNLLENLLQWSRTQIGSIRFVPENINMNEAIQENLHIIKNMAEQKNITIQVDVPDKVYAFADRNMLNTVFRNLLTNSIKFTDKGTIIVSAITNEKNITISVTDTGIGIPPEKMEKIFLIEKSKSTEGTRGETGSGLGLIICKEFIEKNGGKIWVESIPDKGSTFIFTLPLSQDNS